MGVRIEDDAKMLAEQYDIDLAVLKGSGPEGLITRRDVEEYIKEHFFPKVRERRPLRGIRRVIAERLGKSYREAIHVTLNMEVIMDNLVEYRRMLSEKLGDKPSYTILIAKCVAKALKDHPDLNATLENNEIIVYDTVNINIAVDTPFGLLVPVIRRVDEKKLDELIKEYNDIVTRAREGRLKEKDIVGGTFTITNLGMLDVDTFTPIINPPQVAILGVNRMIKKPVVIGDEIKIVNTTMLSLSFDHRAIDGAPAARFLQRVKHYMENPGEIAWL